MYTFIVNPNARSGLGAEVWSQVERILKERNIEYQILFTKYQRHATKLVRELTGDGREHTIVMMGGDGTVNEILNGICEPAKVTLGYIPIGSSNDFARFYGFPKKPEEALEWILSSNRRIGMDIGVMSYRDGAKSRRFGVSTGMGFDAGVCHQAVVSPIKTMLNKLRLGRLTYGGIALYQLMSQKPGRMQVRLDGGKSMLFEKVYFAAAMNHPYEGGGFKFCPKADPGDGKLDVTVVAGISKKKVLALLPTAFKGWHTRVRGVYTYQCREVSFESERPLPVHTDGEPVFLQRKISVRTEIDQVKLIVGQREGR